MSMLRFDIITPVEPLAALPARLVQTSRRGKTMLALVALLVTGIAILLPFLALLLQLAAEPDARLAATEQARSLLLLGLGTSIWMALLGWPFARYARRLVAERTVVLTNRLIEVDERTLFGRKSWCEPIAAYAGLAHHLKATLSGVRHELILVHPKASRSVLIAVAPNFSESEIRRVVTLLGVQEIAAQALYPTRLIVANTLAPSLQSQNA